MNGVWLAAVRDHWLFSYYFPSLYSPLFVDTHTQSNLDFVLGGDEGGEDEDGYEHEPEEPFELAVDEDEDEEDEDNDDDLEIIEEDKENSNGVSVIVVEPEEKRVTRNNNRKRTAAAAAAVTVDANGTPKKVNKSPVRKTLSYSKVVFPFPGDAFSFGSPSVLCTPHFAWLRF